jgi:hypothetical protein
MTSTARMGLFSFVLLLAGCSSGTTQADCDKIANDIRDAGGGAGVCVSTAPADVAKFGKACAALKDCEDKVK